MQNSTILFDSFNAKYLSYQQVADSFVPNFEFTQLQGNNSMLLMGPRGCGKTTLLKMLTPAGTYYWDQKENKSITSEMKFIAIYIPSDIQWKNQLDYLNKRLKNEQEFSEKIAHFLFTTNVQMSMCKTFYSLVHLSGNEKDIKLNYESSICIELIKAWKIEGPLLPTFDDLELQLLKRVSEINTIITRIVFYSQKRSEYDKIPDYVFDHFFDQIRTGCKVLEKILGYPNEQKWALCFDELEIAPKFLQLELISYLRSVDQKYLFKMTTTPLFKLEDSIVEASQGNDFNTIKLWVYDENGLKGWEDFCKKLIRKRLKSKFNISNFLEIEDIFGKYNLDDIIKEELNQLNKSILEKLSYNTDFKPGTGKGSAINYLFKYLASTDPSFNKFLIKRSIDPNDPYSYSKLSTDSKSVFLKYKVDAVYRLIYREKTRRVPPIHYGIPHIFGLCDGNPRLVMGLIDEILLRSTYDDNIYNKISNHIQSQVIFDSSKRYFNLLKNYPDSTVPFKGSEFNLALDLLKPIGDYMNWKIIQTEFSKTSASTFIVDKDLDPRFIQLLEVALYLGAIIYLEPVESLSYSGIIGKRFRLSNFLTPYMKIPNRVNSQVKLSTLLKIEKRKKQIQIDLTA